MYVRSHQTRIYGGLGQDSVPVSYLVESELSLPAYTGMSESFLQTVRNITLLVIPGAVLLVILLVRR